MLVRASLSRASAKAKPPRRLGSPRADHQIVHQLHAVEDHVQTRKLVRDAHRHHTLGAEQSAIHRTPHKQHAIVVNLEPLGVREEQHSQTLTRAVLAKRRGRQVAKRSADSLATEAATYPQVKRRRKVLLARHARPTHHDRALLHGLGVRQDQLAILHRVAVRTLRVNI